MVARRAAVSGLYAGNFFFFFFFFLPLTSVHGGRLERLVEPCGVKPSRVMTAYQVCVRVRSGGFSCSSSDDVRMFDCGSAREKEWREVTLSSCSVSPL